LETEYSHKSLNQNVAQIKPAGLIACHGVAPGTAFFVRRAMAYS
jgi:hypothetical protein